MDMGKYQRDNFKSIKKSDIGLIRQSENLQHIAGNNSWTIYHTSPLHKLSFKKASLKKFEIIFSKKLPGCEVTFSSLKGLPYSIPSLLIEVSRNGKDLYNSVLMTLSAVKDSDDTLSLPLLLVLKPVKKDVVLKTHMIIESTFRCRVRPVKLNEYQAYWLMGIGLMETLRRTSSGLQITYKLPIHISSTIDVYFNEDSLSTIWEGLQATSDSEILNISTLEIFFKEIHNHIKGIYGIDASTSPIITFSLKDLCLQFLDQLNISVKRPETFFMLLSYLMSDCLGDQEM